MTNLLPGARGQLASRRVTGRHTIVPFENDVGIDQDVAAIVHRDRVQTQGFYVRQMPGVITFEVIRRAMESAVEAPMLVLIAQQAVGVAAPARQRQETLRTAHKEEHAVLER